MERETVPFTIYEPPGGTISVDRRALEDLLARLKAQASRDYARYDQSLRQHVFSDEMWARNDPEGFRMFSTLMAPLLAEFVA